MDEIVSRDDEKGREVARQKGRIDEQEMQHARDQAAEKGRVQGVQEERKREDAKQSKQEGMGIGAKIVIGIVVALLIAALLAVLTLSVSVTDVSTNYALPFTTTYAVTFPEGQPIAIGNSQMTVLSYDNELISDIDGNRQKLVIGEDRVINERRAIIKTFGVITLMDTNFQINLKYKGNRDNLVYFDMAIHTSQQVPEVLLKRVLPSEIHATPM